MWIVLAVEKKRGAVVTYLGFYKAFVLVLYHMLISKLEKYEFKGWTIQSIRNWLDDHSERVIVKSSTARWWTVA